jgi:predicted membrane-bound mannosyltransferase
MFRSLMSIIRELYLYLAKVTFMLRHSVKLRRYIYLVMWQHVVERHVCCVQCRVRQRHVCCVLRRMRDNFQRCAVQR